MSNTNTLVVHVIAAMLALLQCGLSIVLTYRLYIMSGFKGPDRRRVTTVYMLRVHRICILIMTTLQFVRCIDPFCALGIWTYELIRVLQLSVTITIYFQYSTTTYVIMDTLYACVLKRTPWWLAYIVSIIPVSECIVGFAMLAAEFAIGLQWVGAVISFYVVFMFAVNMVTYNVSGFLLIRILRTHQEGTPASDDISGSKASPFALVIAKTTRSLVFLTIPSLAALIMFLIIGMGGTNTKPLVPFIPSAPTLAAMFTLFLQLVLGLLFTRVAWISKEALDAEIASKVMTGTPTTQSLEEKRRASSRADTQERGGRKSQSPRPAPRASENSQGASSTSDSCVVEVQIPTEPEPNAVAVDDK